MGNRKGPARRQRRIGESRHGRKEFIREIDEKGQQKKREMGEKWGIHRMEAVYTVIFIHRRRTPSQIRFGPRKKRCVGTST